MWIEYNLSQRAKKTEKNEYANVLLDKAASAEEKGVCCRQRITGLSSLASVLC